MIRRSDLVYPELSYQVVGALFDVYNHLGFGHLEKTYQRAVALAFKEKGITFEEQVPYHVMYRGQEIGLQRLDFLIEKKIVLELKQGDRFRKANFEQVQSYLKNTQLSLAILANFTREGVLFRRVVDVTSHS